MGSRRTYMRGSMAFADAVRAQREICRPGFIPDHTWRGVPIPFDWPALQAIAIDETEVFKPYSE